MTPKMTMSAPLPSTPPAASKGKILVVDDEEDILEVIRYSLSREGYQVTCVDSGERAIEAIRKSVPDVVLLDLMLPGVDGLEVCRRLKRIPETADTPIIMITAKGEDVDIVVGLECGADDYVIKPFSARVLTARVKTILRKRQATRAEFGSVLRFRDLSIFPVHHEVRIGSATVDLTVTEFKILLTLARRAGWVFTRNQLVDLARGDNASVTLRSVDVHIVRLRNKLGVYGDWIETVRTMGYRFRRDNEADSE
jgi:two-component system, OmpR family, alkaline phosphatase synthesis response regulator PhoP